MSRKKPFLSLSLCLCAVLFFSLAAFTPASNEEKWIHIDLSQKRLTLYNGDTVLARYPIASGAQDTPSPLGAFRINRKFTTQMSGFGTRFMGLNVPWGNYGIHGTNNPGSLGQNASHGCIRLSVRNAESLYAQVSYGTRVVIEDGPFGMLGHTLPVLRPGDRRSHVYIVQQRLIALGFLSGIPDGIYGENTSRAILKAREHFSLSREDLVDQALYSHLGILLFE